MTGSGPAEGMDPYGLDDTEEFFEVVNQDIDAKELEENKTRVAIEDDDVQETLTRRYCGGPVHPPRKNGMHTYHCMTPPAHTRTKRNT